MSFHQRLAEQLDYQAIIPMFVVTLIVIDTALLEVLGVQVARINHQRL